MTNITNLDQPLLDFRGEPIREIAPGSDPRDPRTLTLKDAICNILTRRTSGDPLRSWSLARMIYEAGDAINLMDESAFEFIKEAVRTDQTYFDSVRGPVLAAINQPQTSPDGAVKESEVVEHV